MPRGRFILKWTKYYLLLAGGLVVILIALSSRIDVGDDPAVWQRRFEGFSLLVLLGTGALAWLVWWPVSRRLAQMQAIVEEYGHGRFERRMPAGDPTELGALSADLNWMAQQLHCRDIVEADRQRQQQTVLAGMLEGMLAIDHDGCVISLNRAAREMLQLNELPVEGRLVTELVRHPKLLHFIRGALAGDALSDQVLTFNGHAERRVEVTYTPLSTGTGESLGALIMLNDITRMQQLEHIRRDFVANVSHELKTPITSIKGFMETLLDGALNEPAEARRFVEIIARQADRLDAIIEDLLMLSRIEQEADRHELALEAVSVRNAIQGAVQAVEPRAVHAGTKLAWDCPPTLRVKANLPLLEQALVNLLDNAVKYGARNGKVIVMASAQERTVAIAVHDDGPGIPPEHHARLFERFYRVDKSRSRKLGGTGLGLAIVKHIAQAHGGEIAVDSKPGQGATFTLKLPAAGHS